MFRCSYSLLRNSALYSAFCALISSEGSSSLAAIEAVRSGVIDRGE